VNYFTESAQIKKRKEVQNISFQHFISLRVLRETFF